MAKPRYASNSGWFYYDLQVFNTSENILFCFSSYVINYILKIKEIIQGSGYLWERRGKFGTCRVIIYSVHSLRWVVDS